MSTSYVVSVTHNTGHGELRSLVGVFDNYSAAERVYDNLELNTRYEFYSSDCTVDIMQVEMGKQYDKYEVPYCREKRWDSRKKAFKEYDLNVA